MAHRVAAEIKPVLIMPLVGDCPQHQADQHDDPELAFAQPAEGSRQFVQQPERTGQKRSKTSGCNVYATFVTPRPPFAPGRHLPRQVMMIMPAKMISAPIILFGVTSSRRI